MVQIDNDLALGAAQWAGRMLANASSVDKPASIDGRYAVLGPVSDLYALQSFTVGIGFVTLSAFLIMLMQLGWAQMEAGISPVTETQMIFMKNVADTAIACFAFFFVGFSLAYGTEGPVNGFVGSGTYALRRVKRHYIFFTQFMFANTAATCYHGAVAGRMRFVSYMLVTFYLTAVVYPIAAHWIWSPGSGPITNGVAEEKVPGWLLGLGAVDFAGASVVDVLGGAVGLAGTLALGPRIGFTGKKMRDKSAAAHNKPLAASGAYMLWIGYMAYLAMTAAQVSGEYQAEVVGRIAVVALMSTSSCIMTFFLIRKVLGRPYDLVWQIQSIVAGMVAVTACCASIDVWVSIIVGFVAAFVLGGVSSLLRRFKVDDPLDSIAIHLGCGGWSLVAQGLFARPEYLEQTRQDGPNLAGGLLFTGDGALLAAQVAALVSVAAWAFCSVSPLFLLLRWTGHLRISREEELGGIDLFKHGSSAYPAFAFVQARERDPEDTASILTRSSSVYKSSDARKRGGGDPTTLTAASFQPYENFDREHRHEGGRANLTSGLDLPATTEAGAADPSARPVAEPSSMAGNPVAAPGHMDSVAPGGDDRPHAPLAAPSEGHGSAWRSGFVQSLIPWSWQVPLYWPWVGRRPSQYDSNEVHGDGGGRRRKHMSSSDDDVSPERKARMARGFDRSSRSLPVDRRVSVGDAATVQTGFREGRSPTAGPRHDQDHPHDSRSEGEPGVRRDSDSDRDSMVDIVVDGESQITSVSRQAERAKKERLRMEVVGNPQAGGSWRQDGSPRGGMDAIGQPGPGHMAATDAAQGGRSQDYAYMGAGTGLGPAAHGLGGHMAMPGGHPAMDMVKALQPSCPCEACVQANTQAFAQALVIAQQFMRMGGLGGMPHGHGVGMMHGHMPMPPRPMDAMPVPSTKDSSQPSEPRPLTGSSSSSGGQGGVARQGARSPLSAPVESGLPRSGAGQALDTEANLRGRPAVHEGGLAFSDAGSTASPRSARGEQSASMTVGRGMDRNRSGSRPGGLPLSYSGATNGLRGSNVGHLMSEADHSTAPSAYSDAHQSSVQLSPASPRRGRDRPDVVTGLALE